MLKISASRNYEVLFVLAALFFKFCSLFFVMCQNVKRRLVVRSNDDGRRSTTIFSENVAVTEISKKKNRSLIILRLGDLVKKKNKNKNKTTTKRKENKTTTTTTVKLSGMNIVFENTRKNI